MQLGGGHAVGSCGSGGTIGGSQFQPVTLPAEADKGWLYGRLLASRSTKSRVAPQPSVPRAGSRRGLLLSKLSAFCSVDQTNQLDKAATRYPWEWMQWESDSRHWNAFDFGSSWNRPLRQAGGVGLGWQHCRVPKAGAEPPQDISTPPLPAHSAPILASPCPTLTCVPRLTGALIAVDLVDALAVVAGVAGAVVQVDLAVGPLRRKAGVLAGCPRPC